MALGIGTILNLVKRGAHYELPRPVSVFDGQGNPVLINGTSYEAVAVITTAVMGGTGASGDLLNGVLVIPGTTSPGAVQIKDGSGSAITVFVGGATSVSSLVPFFVYLGAKSTAGAWSVITGANVTAIGVGSFT